MMRQWIDDRLGTPRGAIRLGLSYAEVAGGFAPILRPSRDAVRRLVFVCHGNICRSAYAEALAQRAGYAAASFGLSTSTGSPAHPPIAAVAAERGLDLSAHRTTRVEDFEPLPGDYLLAMEVRHLRKIAALPAIAQLPRGLLGGYAGLPLPHLHDPYKLGDGYLRVCLTRVEDAVERLCVSFPAARRA